MLYWIFKIEWSQTDSDMVIVQAVSRDQAEDYLKRKHNFRYIHFYGSVNTIAKV